MARILLLFALCLAGVQAQTRTVVGAIRWDAWHGQKGVPGKAMEKSLGPTEWHHRLPFFARILSPAEVRIEGDSQQIMDREIAFAKRAGLDYWAFLAYDPADPMSLGLKYYLSSRHRNHIRFCLITEQSRWGTRSNHKAGIDRIVQLMGETNYQTVLDGRPLFYLGFIDDETTRRNWGTEAEFRTAIDELRAAVIKSGSTQSLSRVDGLRCRTRESPRFSVGIRRNQFVCHLRWRQGGAVPATYNRGGTLLGALQGYWSASRADHHVRLGSATASRASSAVGSAPAEARSWNRTLLCGAFPERTGRARRTSAAVDRKQPRCNPGTCGADLCVERERRRRLAGANAIREDNPPGCHPHSSEKATIVCHTCRSDRGNCGLMPYVSHTGSRAHHGGSRRPNQPSRPRAGRASGGHAGAA